MGGEKAPRTTTPTTALGSPPHGRGKGSSFVTRYTSLRITPAWAGKSISQTSTTKLAKDHPRMGGEKCRIRREDRKSQGSPPHGRGKDETSMPCTRPLGITPAWAGKSFQPPFDYFVYRDHPRMGGEKILVLETPLHYTGSPPHGRGKAAHELRTLPRAGITPAWAGKSLAFSSSASRS